MIDQKLTPDETLKTHKLSKRLGFYWADCGQRHFARWSDRWGKVTCKRCLRRKP